MAASTSITSTVTVMSATGGCDPAAVARAGGTFLGLDVGGVGIAAAAWLGVSGAPGAAVTASGEVDSAIGGVAKDAGVGAGANAAVVAGVGRGAGVGACCTAAGSGTTGVFGGAATSITGL